VAGFETTSSTIAHALYELAFNPDIQESLSDQLVDILHGKDPNSNEYFDTVINGIPYLEATIKETLRKYPSALITHRRCGVDGYRLGGIPLTRDQLIVISLYALHHNPDYFPDPFRFKPERFMPENRHLLTPYTFMPFGVGPRNCIGMRFADQEMKLALAGLLRRYRFEPLPDTPKRLTFRSRTIVLYSCPFRLKVTKRQ
jgi:cytochrome P450